MPKVKISEYSATANSNTDVASINIDEGCAPSGINNAIRAVMGHLKDFQQGTYGDPFNGPVNGTVGATTPSTGAFTTLSATGNVTLGDAITDTLNVGNGGLIKDASGNLGLGVTPSSNAGLSTLNIANYNRTFSALTLGSNANSAGYIGYNMGNTSSSNTWKYISADTGSALYFAGNEYRFMQFASGSAGATTSGTQAMTLDASGNLLVGGTSNAAGARLLSENATGNQLGLRYTSIATWYNSVDSSGNYIWTKDGTNIARFDPSGNLLVGKTGVNATDGGFLFTSGAGTDQSFLATNIRSDGGGDPIVVNRQGSDGNLINFRHANTSEGTISVSGTTVTYGGGHLARFGQLPDGSEDPTLLKGTVLTNLDEMCVWINKETGIPADNEQCNKVKISDVDGDSNVAGVFVSWSYDEQHDTNDLFVAMTGDMIIRIAQGVTVARGDLLMSAGDGTAKPQGDDIVRSKTVAKVTSTHVTCTYSDGSYCVPCVLMAC
jgi:hypothetical protein